jgi:hypothetical protein
MSVIPSASTGTRHHCSALAAFETLKTFWNVGLRPFSSRVHPKYFAVNPAWGQATLMPLMHNGRSRSIARGIHHRMKGAKLSEGD